MNTDEHGSGGTMSNCIVDATPQRSDKRVDGGYHHDDREATVDPESLPHWETPEGRIIVRTDDFESFVDRALCEDDEHVRYLLARLYRVEVGRVDELLHAAGLCLCSQCHTWCAWDEFVDELGWPDDQDRCQACRTPLGDHPEDEDDGD